MAPSVFKKPSHFLIVLIVILLQFACSSGTTIYAPVSDAAMIDPIPKTGIYKVQRGDSFYSIAWRYGLDPHDLAKRNHLAPPYTLYIGDKLYLRGKPTVPILTQTKVMPLPPKIKAIKTAKKQPPPILPVYEPNAPVYHWFWPAKGPLLGEFSGVNKGINIGGHEGDSIVSAAAGKVVYSGDGLRRYGNLLIIEHNNIYMTAYAYNKIILVKEGQVVKAGQKVAEMGNTGTQRVMLHFEIRKKGRPVNPLAYLKR